MSGQPDEAVKFLPYGRQHVDDEDIRAVVEVLRSDYLTQGPRLGDLEKALAGRVWAGECVAAANGTAALHLVALALALKPGDAWITSPITFVATANAARFVGATPIFADVDQTGCLDPQSVPAAVAKAKKLGLVPRVLAGVDLAGQPADWAGLAQAAQEFDLVLVDDACHALGAAWTDPQGQRRPIGCGKTASLTAFSFHPVKHVTTGEGGAVTTDDPDLAAKMRLFRSHGTTKSGFLQPDLAFDPQGRLNPWYYEQHCLGFNYRLTELQAALGLSQLRKLDHFLARRRQIATIYDQAFQYLDLIQPLPKRPGAENAYHLYIVRIDFPALGLSRAQVMNLLADQGVGTQVHYIPVHLQPDFRQHCGTRPGDCPRAEALYHQILSLPMYPDLTDIDLDRVTTALRRLAGR